METGKRWRWSMAVKKGDLIQIDLPRVDSMTNAEVQQELFSSLRLLTDEDFLIAVTAPYEHEQPVIGSADQRGRMFLYNSLTLCVDLLLGEKIYKAVPLKYLKRA
jgi:hypothetical protein